LRMQLR